MPTISPEAMADLNCLSRDHGVSADLIASLKTSKTQARSHIGFFKRMMFLTNGGVMTIGLALAGFGVQRLANELSVLGAVSLIAGMLLFVKFTTVFASMTRAIRATEAVARKHHLI